jgi:5-methylcytosine-specific restriction enzyme subunit McrC
MVVPPQLITLREYAPVRLAPDAFAEEAGALLWQRYGIERRVVDVAFPSPRTGGQWELNALGWVGHIPLTPSVHLRLEPRTPLANLFRLLAYAYRLDQIDFLPGLVACDSLPDFYEQLAHYLARAVLARRRRGLYHAYVRREEALPVVRGRIRPRPHQPPQPQLDCEFDEHTADVPENQLLAYTLHAIARSGLCGEAAQRAVRQAYHSLAGVSAAPVAAHALTNWHYHPLNQDYAPLHALCHFFLTHTGPGHGHGDQQMVPFLVDMARLFEQVVARWLQEHLPAPWLLRAQERVEAPGQTPLAFTLDMVLYDQAGAAVLVLDTKYRAEVTAADVQQIVTYAQLRGCRDAVLVYPETPRRPLDVHAGDIRVRTLTFALDSDLHAAGSAFLAALDLTPAATFSPDKL